MLRPRPLPRSFYARPVLQVARDCIGKVLVRETRDGVVTGRIVEAEAYRGPEDRAAHSFGGRRTLRTEVMFGEAGHAYVFLVYGLHWHFNLVTGKEGEPHAVLMRAVEPLSGAELMQDRRGRPRSPRDLTSGPGKLCTAFAIDGRDYGSDLCGPRAGRALYLADGERPERIVRCPRVGVDYAGSWARRPWRFLDPSSACVSGVRASRRAA